MYHYNKSPEGKHQKERDNAVEHDHPAFSHLLGVSGMRDVLEDSPDNNHKRDPDEKRNDGIRDTGELVRESGKVETGVCAWLEHRKRGGVGAEGKKGERQ